MKCIAWLALAAALASADARRPVIAIGGINHESNTFNPRKTRLADFTPRNIAREEFLRETAKSNSTVSGFIAGARESGFDVHPLFDTEAPPLGPVTRDAFDTLTRELIAGLKAAPKLDGLLLYLMGAMVTEDYPVADAEVVRRVRAAMGDRFPIVVVHDYHANVSEEIVQLTTALLTYKECPHLDSKQRGVQAARIIAGIVSGKWKPAQALVKPPMMYNLVFQNTFRPPFGPVTEESRRLEKNPKILAASVPGGYQYGDVPTMGPSVVVVTDNDPGLAKREAQRLSDMLWATRDKLVLNLPDPAKAVAQAMAGGKFPVALFDTGDNIGGGSSGDSTFILAELLRQKASGWFVPFTEPEAAAAAFRAGVGQPFDQLVGGKADKLHGAPVRVRGRVRSLHLGTYFETEVRHAGRRYFDMGLTAIIEAEGSAPDLPNLVMLTTKPAIPLSIHQLTSCGIYPERLKILVVKGTIAPRPAYEPVAALIIEVDSPGVTAVNPKRFVYKNVRRPMFGL
ncbi:MAG: M81 family metallopeptidase [Acidobacteria bacterium]|nr:M81 family metallopeptidase [Acidobacteriota bacterium]